ncbi:hypothetical protein AB0F03_37860, partial [Streptomyces sp. NPDC028722]|uniref:hypothetical protein n=1 Tax=Streptomyces sp. NPDC028722 TaxID=3155016 RepID=UPI0033F879E5
HGRRADTRTAQLSPWVVAGVSTSKLLTGHRLAPVHLTPIPGTTSHQGALSRQHKKHVHKAFDKKVKRALNGQPTEGGDWSGVHAIIESIVYAFD